MENKKADIQQDTRTPADKLLLDFLKNNNIALIIDTPEIVKTQIDKVLYAVEKSPRLRALYLDQIETNEPTPKVEVAN